MTKSHKDRFQGTGNISRELGVDYLVEGRLRQDGKLARIDLYLSDARTGAQVWSKSFKVNVTVSNLLAIQDEISGQASAMIGSYWGAIGAAEYKRIQNKPSAELTPYECIVQGVIGVPTDATVLEPVVKARECLERLTRDEPRNAAAWAALVLVFNSQRTWGFPSPTGEVGSIEDRLYLADLAVEAANRAVEIAPNDAFVRGLVARAAWMACQPDLLRIETMRAIELNPNDPQNLGPLGNLMAYAGFWDEGVALAEKGIALTAPSTPRWWWWAPAKRGFAFRRLYRRFDAFRRSYVEQLWISHLHMAYTLPFLDRVDRSQGACSDVVEDATRILDPRSRRLLQNVVLCAVLSRADVRRVADRRTARRPARGLRRVTSKAPAAARRHSGARAQDEIDAGTRPTMPYRRNCSAPVSGPREP